MPSAYRELAQQLADLGADIVRRYYRSAYDIDAKGDETPVTRADREAEAAMRAEIVRRFPAHGIIGEEMGAERPEARHVWVLDPIDGTKAFITGRPLFATLIALMEEGRPVLGLIDQPILRERWFGARGVASTFNDRPTRVRACPDLAHAILSTTSPDLFAGADAQAFARLRARARFVQYGGDGYAYATLASGFVDLVVEAGLKTHDFCALVPVIENAGGLITDWRGAALHAGSDGRVIAAGDARVHAAALQILGAPPPS